MTENKRFTFEIKTQDNRAYTQWYDNGKPINSAETIVGLLNGLSEQRDYFERKKEYFLSKWSIVNAENIQLRQENKELKQFKQQVFDLIDEKIIFVDTCNQNYKLSKDYYRGALDILELLKKELEHD